MLFEAVVLSNSSKDTLPVPIHTSLPHIRLQLGASDSDADAPQLSCVVDTAAALTTGNSHFLFKVAKTFPGCVSAVYTSENYNPIQLSGVVQRNGAAVTAELSVAFVFHLPYFTTDGQPAQLMVAAGPHVTVNLILGMPFISAAKMVLDFSDNVVESRALDCPPFPIESKKAQLALPTVQASQVRGHSPEIYASFLAELDRLEAFVHSADASSTVPSTKRVRIEAPDSRDETSKSYVCDDALLTGVPPDESLAFDHGLVGENHQFALNAIDE